MSNTSRQEFDVLVVGGGPAGIAAAVCAAECGSRVGIVDDNFRLGGQIWRTASGQQVPEELSAWYARLQTAGVTVVSGKTVFHQPEPGVVLAEGNDDLVELRYRNLILATGARERFLPFPGWTLPNVMGAGGLQAMVKSGLPIRGKRVVIAGSGPLLLAVASYLKEHGAVIPVVCEQAPLSKLVRFAASLWQHWEKVSQGLQLRRQLAGLPLATSSWPLSAQGRDSVESVTVLRAGRPETIPCDYLACGFHLVPNIELAQLLGCKTHGGVVQVDDLQRTNIRGIHCAGEPAGVGGVESSLVEGQIAGLAAAGHATDARSLFGARKKARSFARALDRAFQLRPELRRLPSPETFVCRCEDVPYSRLREQTNWRSAKLHTRCGMGPCQGRVCGPATQFLFQWNPESVRPPVYPVRVQSLAGISQNTDPAHVAGGVR